MKLKSRLKSPGMILFGSYAAMALGSLPVILLLCFADHLGVWWFILLSLYMILLTTVYFLILRPREIARIRGLLADDELFFQLYPKEKLREERRRTRAQHKTERYAQRRGSKRSSLPEL